MKHIILFLLLLIAKNSFTQNLNINSKYGYAIGKTTKFKKTMLYESFDLCFEPKISETISLNFGIGISNLQFDYSDSLNSSIFNKLYFISIPISFKKYFIISKRSSEILQFGILNNLLFYQHKEFINSNNNTVSNKNKIVGNNLGIFFNAGFKTMISQNQWYVCFSFGGFQDFLHSYKDNLDEITFNTKSLEITFSKKFK